MESFLGSGDLYMDRLDADGTRNGLFLAGNAIKFEIQANAEIKNQLSKGRNTYGQVLASATLNQPPQIKISLNQLDSKNLALAFLGTESTISVSGSTVTDEALTVITLDQYQRLAKRNVTAATVAVTRVNGDDASVAAVSTAYLLGAFVEPATPNTHFYKCTQAGTSGGTAPTWPTDGSEVTDGTAKFTDMGLIIAAATDYEVIGRTGMFRALSTGNIEAGEALEIDYTYGASSGWKVEGAIQPTIKAYLMLDGKNETNGNDVEVEAWEVQLKPTSPVDFLADDFTSLELEGTPVTPTGYASPFIIRQFDL